MMKLEHKAHVPVSKLCQPGMIKKENIIALKQKGPAIGTIKGSKYVEQRRLADSGRSDNSQSLSGIQIKVYTF
jgi:hypothetical protein